jgi:2-oxoisovalerate dehydrogenase E2 component (dihydrolipoyl transacylase)
MTEKVFMPQLGESVVEGTIEKWIVQLGDKVNVYDPLCEITTDKVTAEVPSTVSGTISEMVVKEGETVAVGDLICCITVEGPAAQVDFQPVMPVSFTGASGSRAAAKEVAKHRYSPAVLKIAQEHNLDPSTIQGTGAGGRITRKDMMEAAAGKKQIVAFPAQNPMSGVPIGQEDQEDQEDHDNRDDAPNSGDSIIPVTAARATIANRMVLSKREAPHAWTMMECDVTHLVTYRSQVKDDFKKKEGIHLTYLPFFIKAVVEALKEFPVVNSHWAGDKIIVKKAIHISIAVAADTALLVPVIKDADQKNIAGLAKTVELLVKKSREGKLTVDDLSGGTFTVNNTGAFGSILSAPIINPPQAAILSMEAIVKRPIVIGSNMIAIRDMVNICLSLDHRILDGLVCGRFLQRVKKILESYNSDTKLY